jgi:hypothetical protein
VSPLDRIELPSSADSSSSSPSRLQPKVFPKTRTLSFILLKPTAHLIRWEMVVEYTWAIGTTRMIHSLVELTLNDAGKVSHMVDRWEGKELDHRMGVRPSCREPAV